MHFFVQLCRQNNESENSKVFSAFKPSIKTSDDVVENNLFRITIVLLKFKILHSNRIQTGSVQNGWKIPVAKWTELAL